MEYPMCTLITAEGSLNGLISVTVHEAIHSWFQGLLAQMRLNTNGWMKAFVRMLNMKS